MAVARLIRLMAALVVAVIVAAILLRLTSANPHNAVVSHVHDAARTLVGPFSNVFSLRDPQAALAVNWGLAALVYLLAGHALARLIARTSPRTLHRVRPVA
jgi:hypothetical protein